MKIIKVLISNGADVNATNTYNETALMGVSLNGYIELVTLLIDKGADVNQKDNDGLTALKLASLAEHIEIVRKLISNGADVSDEAGASALAFATKIEDYRMIEDLENKGTSPRLANIYKLSEAIINGDAAKVKVLIAEGADANIKLGLLIAINKANSANIMERFDKSEKYLDIAIELINNGANVNQASSSNETPLIIASERDNLELVKLLIANGANVNARSRGYGYTALFNASINSMVNNTTEVAKELVSNGADVNIKCSHLGQTVLYFAAMEGKHRAS